MKNRDYYKKVHEDGLDLPLYTSYLAKVYGESTDKERAKNELIMIHQQLKVEIDEADFHVRMISVPATKINSTEMYTMAQAIEILQVSRTQLRELIKESTIKAKRVNKRVLKPYKWSVDAYANNLTAFISSDCDEIGDTLSINDQSYEIHEVFYERSKIINAIEVLLSRKKKIFKYLKQ